MKRSASTLAATIGLCTSLAAVPTQANVIYEYTGNLLSDGSGPVTASVTFDSTVISGFSGLVAIDHVTHWHIESGLLSFTSDALVDEPDATGHIPLRFEFTSGAITRWDFDHNLLSAPAGPTGGYDIYTMGKSFVVGFGVTEDGALDIAGVNQFVTGNPGSWTKTAIPVPATWALLIAGLGVITMSRARVGWGEPCSRSGKRKRGPEKGAEPFFSSNHHDERA